MLMLALEASAITASAALTEDDEVLRYKLLNDGKMHSEVLMPLVEEIMGNNTCADLDAIAVSNGPGSFTGVRIGVSTVKGLAFTNDTDCIAVSTLEAIAYNFEGEDAVICAAMDARRDQYYTALFKAEGGKITRLTEDSALQDKDIEEELRAYKKEKIIIAGDGARKLKGKIQNENAVLAPEKMIYQNAVGVARAAKGKPHCRAKEIMPFYLRPSGAERNIRLKKGE